MALRVYQHAMSNKRQYTLHSTLADTFSYQWWSGQCERFATEAWLVQLVLFRLALLVALIRLNSQFVATHYWRPVTTAMHCSSPISPARSSVSSFQSVFTFAAVQPAKVLWRSASRCHAVCVSAALLSAAKIMRCSSSLKLFVVFLRRVRRWSSEWLSISC